MLCPAAQVITNKLVNEKYLMYNCGTAIPSPLPAGVTKVFQGPLTSASVADATAADFMVGLGSCHTVLETSAQLLADWPSQLSVEPCR
jgi:hypothetical protein